MDTEMSEVELEPEEAAACCKQTMFKRAFDPDADGDQGDAQAV